MKALTILACAALTFGCDDEYVIENIDVFTCAWLPNWMATCDDPAVHDIALGILEHGVVGAHAVCDGSASFPFSGYPGAFRLKLSKLVDGSVLGQLATGDGNYEVSDFCPRGTDCASPPSLTAHKDYSGDNTAVFTLDGGLLTVVMDGPGFNPPGDPTPPWTAFSDDIGDACTGFNLEAFD